MPLTAADLVVKFSTSGEQNVTRAMSGAGKAVSGFAGAAQVATGVLGAQFANAAFSAVRGVTDFGAAMANVNSIAQLSGKGIAQLSDQVLALTSDPRIAQGPATLAEGLYDIYSSGFQGAEGMKVLEQAALAATAGVTDTATASRAITASLNAFGLGAADVQRVSDVLFQTVNDGVITFEQLANNLGNVLPIANSLGLGIEDVGAAYAQMTLKGVQASQAETQIAALMRSALNPTEALTAAVTKHGYASAAAAIENEGLAGFLAILNDAAGGSQEAMFDLLGTQEAMNAATILGADGVKDYNKELEKMNKASKGAGATNKALEKQMESSSFQIQKAKQSLQTLAVVGFGVLAPAVSRGAQLVTSLVQKFIPFVNILKRATGEGFHFGEGFDRALKKFPAPLRRTVHGIASLTDALSDMWRNGFSKNEARQALHALQAIGEELMQGAKWVANVVIDSVVSLAGWLWDHKGAIWEGIKDFAGWTTNNFRQAVEVVIDGAVRLAGELGDAADDLWGWIKGKLFGGQGATPTTGGMRGVPSTWGQGGAPAAGGTNTVDIGTVDVFAKLGAIIWSGVTEGIAAANDELHGKLDKQFLTEPVSWKLPLNLPELSLPQGFTSGAEAGNYVASHLGEIVTTPFRNWKLLLAVPAVVFFVANFPALVGAFIVNKLTGLSPKELVSWTLTVGVPFVFSFAAGFAYAVVNKIVEKMPDLPDVPLPSWDLGVYTPNISLGFDLDDLVDWIKSKVDGLGVPSIDIIPNFNLQLPSWLGGGNDDHPGGKGKPAGGHPNFAQPYSFAPVIPKPDTKDFDQGMTGVIRQLERLDDKSYPAKLDADNRLFTMKHLATVMQGQNFARETFTAKFNADDSGVVMAYNRAVALGNVWAGLVFTARLSLDTSGAQASLAAVVRELRAAGF